MCCDRTRPCREVDTPPCSTVVGPLSPPHGWGSSGGGGLSQSRGSSHSVSQSKPQKHTWGLPKINACTNESPSSATRTSVAIAQLLKHAERFIEIQRARTERAWRPRTPGFLAKWTRLAKQHPPQEADISFQKVPSLFTIHTPRVSAPAVSTPMFFLSSRHSRDNEFECSKSHREKRTLLTLFWADFPQGRPLLTTD